jgi:hydroxypyruvate reductase
LAFVLNCVEKIAGKRIAVLSAGTDGVDGSSPAAGAVADGESLARARGKGLSPGDYYRRSDSYTFFRELGDAIETGPTGNNLRDLRILLAE